MKRENIKKRLDELKVILKETEWLDVEHHLARIAETLGEEAAKDAARKMIEVRERWARKHETN